MKKTDSRVLTCTDCKEAYTISSKLTKQTKLGGGMKRAAENLYTCTECSRIIVKRSPVSSHDNKTFHLPHMQDIFYQKCKLKGSF